MSTYAERAEQEDPFADAKRLVKEEYDPGIHGMGIPESEVTSHANGADAEEVFMEFFADPDIDVVVKDHGEETSYRPRSASFLTYG